MKFLTNEERVRMRNLQAQQQLANSLRKKQQQIRRNIAMVQMLLNNKTEVVDEVDHLHIDHDDFGYDHHHHNDHHHHHDHHHHDHHHHDDNDNNNDANLKIFESITKNLTAVSSASNNPTSLVKLIDNITQAFTNAPTPDHDSDHDSDHECPCYDTPIIVKKSCRRFTFV